MSWRGVLRRGGRLAAAGVMVLGLSMVMVLRTPTPANAAASLDGIAAQVADVQDQVAVLSTTTSYMSSQLKDIATRVNGVRTVVDGHTTTLGEIRTISTTAGDKADLARQYAVAARDESVSMRVQVDYAVAQNKALAVTLNPVSAAVVGAGSPLDQARVYAIDTKKVADASSTKIDYVQEQARALANQISALNTARDGDRRSVEAKVAEVDAKAAALRADVASLTQQQSSDTAQVLDAIDLLAAGDDGVDSGMTDMLAALESIRDRQVVPCEGRTRPDYTNPWALLAGSPSVDDECLSSRADTEAATDRVVSAVRALAEGNDADEADRKADAEALRVAVRAVQDQAREDTDRIVEKLRELQQPEDPEPGHYEAARMPRMQSWVSSVSCLSGAVGQLEGSSGCDVGPVVPVTAGVEIRPFSTCGIGDRWRSDAKGVASVVLIITGAFAGLRALLSSLSMGEAVH